MTPEVQEAIATEAVTQSAPAAVPKGWDSPAHDSRYRLHLGVILSGATTD